MANSELLQSSGSTNSISTSLSFKLFTTTLPMTILHCSKYVALFISCSTNQERAETVWVANAGASVLWKLKCTRFQRTLNSAEHHYLTKTQPKYMSSVKTLQIPWFNFFFRATFSHNNLKSIWCITHTVVEECCSHIAFRDRESWTLIKWLSYASAATSPQLKPCLGIQRTHEAYIDEFHFYIQSLNWNKSLSAARSRCICKTQSLWIKVNWMITDMQHLLFNNKTSQ